MQRRSLPSMFFIVKNTITFQYLLGWDNQPADTETPMEHLRRIVEHGPRVGVRVAALTERPDMPALSADAVLKGCSTILGLATADVISSRRFIGESGLEYLDPRYSKPGRGVMVDNGEAVQFRALSLGRGYGVAAGLAAWLARAPQPQRPARTLLTSPCTRKHRGNIVAATRAEDELAAPSLSVRGMYNRTSFWSEVPEPGVAAVACRGVRACRSLMPLPLSAANLTAPPRS